MENIIKTEGFTFHVDGSSIRLAGGRADTNTNSEISNGRTKFYVGVISILPRIQVAIGNKLSTFIRALELSRSPLALQKIMANGKLETHKIIRLETGKIPERTIATLDTYQGVVIGVTYNVKLLQDKGFRQLVKLSAMHQIRLCKYEDQSKLFLATRCISELTHIDRDKLIVQETARSIRVRVVYKSKLGIPVYYIFVLDNSKYYRLSQIAYDYNDAISLLKAGR